MKRCPQCDSLFDDLYQFCDLDGTPLVKDDASDPRGDGDGAQNWKILTIGAIAGLAMGVVLFVIYHGITRRSQPSSPQAIVSTSTGPELPPPILRAETAVIPSSTPEPSTSPSPSPSPTVSPSPKPSPSIQLSSSPISTGATGNTRVRIRLTTGATIEADEAWKGPEGIWYRYHGVVALLDPTQVKSIERALPTSSPSAAASPQPQK